MSLRARLKMKLNPSKRIEKSCRDRIYKALIRYSAEKFCHSMALLSCTIPQFKAYLEAKFLPGMSWVNYGPVWHIDHIKPCAAFDLTDLEQQRQCFHYTNMQPLLAFDNLSKGPHRPIFLHGTAA